MGPVQALKATTIHAEGPLGWSGRIGSTTAGQFADVRVARGTQLEDISFRQRVEFVMKGEVIYRNEVPPASAAGKSDRSGR